MSRASFFSGFADGLRLVDDLKNSAVQRQISNAQMAENAATLSDRLALQRAQAGKAMLEYRFGRSTANDSIELFRADAADKIREFKLKSDLDPKVRELANVKASADIATANNVLADSTKAGLVTADEWNNYLQESKKSYRVKDTGDGRYTLVDLNGKQIGDAVTAEQLMYSLQNPTGYAKDTYDYLQQLGSSKPKQSDPLAIMPNTSMTTPAQPSSGGTVTVSPLLGLQDSPKVNPAQKTVAPAAVAAPKTSTAPQTTRGQASDAYAKFVSSIVKLPSVAPLYPALRGYNSLFGE